MTDFKDNTPPQALQLQFRCPGCGQIHRVQVTLDGKFDFSCGTKNYEGNVPEMNVTPSTKVN